MIVIKDTALACCKHRYVKLISTFASIFSSWNVDSASLLRFEELQRSRLVEARAFYDPIMGGSVYSLYPTVIISPRLSFSAG
jgi:hypothetical protein